MNTLRACGSAEGEGSPGASLPVWCGTGALEVEMCQPFKDQGLVCESSEAEQAFGNPAFWGPGHSHGNCKADRATAMAVDRLHASLPVSG